MDPTGAVATAVVDEADPRGVAMTGADHGAEATTAAGRAGGVLVEAVRTAVGRVPGRRVLSVAVPSGRGTSRTGVARAWCPRRDVSRSRRSRPR